MLFFVALNVLLIGFVHNSVIVPQATTEFMTSSTQQAESYQEACSNTMESYTNVNGINGGLQEFQSSTSEMAQSFQQEASSSTMEMESFNANGIAGGVQEYASSTSEMAQSFQQEASSSTTEMESFNANGILGGDVQEYASTQTRSESASAQSSSSFSNYEHATGYLSPPPHATGYIPPHATGYIPPHATGYLPPPHATGFIPPPSNSHTAFNRELYLRAFEKNKFITEIERQLYLTWLETLSHNSLNYYDNILEYLNIQQALSNEFLDFNIVQKEISSVYEMFKTSGIYSVDVDLNTKTAIFEKSKLQIQNALKGLAQESALYKLLQHSINEDLISLPTTVGLFSGIIRSQETYFSQTSVTSSTSTVQSVGSQGQCVM